MKKTKYLLLLLILLPYLSQAQPYINIFQLRYEYLKEVSYVRSPNLLKSSYRSAEIFLPFELKNKNVILCGAGLHQVQLRLKGNDIKKINNIYSISLQLGGIKQWNDRWSMMFLAIPKINSDLSEITIRHYQIGGVAVFSFKKRHNLKYKFGLYYNREFFGNFFMPLAGVDWQINKKLNIFGVLPGSMNIEYQINKLFYIQFAYRSVTGSYRLNDAFSNFYVREGDNFWGYNKLELILDYYPWENITFSTGIGHSFWREYNLFDDKDKLSMAKIIYQPFYDGFYIHSQVAYRVRFDKSK